MIHKSKICVLICVFIVVILSLNVIGDGITHTMLYDAYLPYKGVTIVLDAGHGGSDLGCEYGGVNESELNLDVVYKIKEKLDLLGIQVILTRSDENDLASQDAVNRKSEDLKNRIDIINQDQVDLYISVHMNAYANSSAKGSQIFYYSENIESEIFAKSIDDCIKEVSESTLEIQQGDVYYILNKASKVGILLECAFLSNDIDRNKILDESYRQDFANEVVKGIINYLKEKYYE